MTIQDEIKRLKDIYIALRNDRDAARKAYDIYRNASIGDYDHLAASETRDAYNAAAAATIAAWDAYITLDQETTVKENKRIAVKKMIELKVIAWNARNIKLGAAKSRDDAWAIYIKAVDVFNAAEALSEASRKDADDYEATDYEAPDYTPVG